MQHCGEQCGGLRCAHDGELSVATQTPVRETVADETIHHGTKHFDHENAWHLA